MKKNNGFTLIEILIAIALIVIMSSFFLMLIAANYRILNKTKAITEEVFLAQRVMEEEIDSVKKEIQDINQGITPDDPRTLHAKTVFNADLGGIEVSYYETEIDLNSRHYFTYISNIKPEPLEIIKLESVDSNVKHNDINVVYGYASSDFGVVGEFTNLEAYKYDHLLNQVEWYVASEKFIMPMPKSADFDMDDDLVYNSYYFPVFPKDYTLIDNETVFDFGTNYTTFDLFEDFGGRHIVYSVTPAAKSGKLGEQMVSGSVFVSGLPITEDLIMHFDASYIDSTILSEVQEDTNNWFVWKWFDISSIIGHTTPTHYAQNPSLNPPVVKRTEEGDGNPFIGQYVSFDDNQKLRIIKNTSGDLTVFSVVRNRSTTNAAEYLSHGGTILNIEVSAEESFEVWRLKMDVVSTNGNEFEIGGNSLNMAEMIVYQGTLSASEINDIENYILNKYNEVIIGAED